MIVGLTILKNATLMGYPWVESILGVIDICDHFHVSEGYSEDDTWDILQALQQKYGVKMSLSRYEWPAMQTGFAIGSATNFALDQVRNFGGKILYVQADELWHPDDLPYLVQLANMDIDGFDFEFLHLEHNCQIVQQGAGYQAAIRMVANKLYITSHRDGWTFEGCKSIIRARLPKPVVHCNYCFWENQMVKKVEQAEELYPDLGHYGASARQAVKEYCDAGGEPPGEYTKTTSPFAAFLPPLFLPMLGQIKYYVRPELLA